MQYIAELVESKQIQQPQVIAGSSIGAFNGAILASHQPFSTAVDTVNKLWELLAQTKILNLNLSAFISYTAKFFPQPLSQSIQLLLKLTAPKQNFTSLLDNEPIEKLLRDTISKDGLLGGIELWVAAFPSLNINSLRDSIGFPILDILPDAFQDYIVDLASSTWKVQEPHYFCIQDFKDNEDDLYKVLLASAALPLAFPKQEINGQSYVDGGLGDNIPLRALAKNDCTHVIVIHLDNGFIQWNQYDFPEKNIIEIRPQKEITTTLLDFSQENLATLQQRGYEDAKYFLDNILRFSTTVQNTRDTLNLLINSTKRFSQDSALS
ncbi:Patatin [Rivularia sp. IAM M-261]|nr:Patatin [Rivularia sp. IAM M-261]